MIAPAAMAPRTDCPCGLRPSAERPRWNCSRALCHGDRPKGRRGSRVHEENAKDSTLRDRARTTASKGGDMTIPFEKLKARLLANPNVKAEYDALTPEFEIADE